MNSDLRHGFYLRELLVEPTKGRITGRIRSVHLSPKAMEVLLCLAERPGDLVSRDELIERVGGVSHGNPEALNRAVSEIRHTLDDHADKPIYVQTLPQRDYRLIIRPVLQAEHASIHTAGTRGGSRIHATGLLDKLKQRGVLETAFAYLVLGWLIIQVVDVLFDQLHLPAWAGTFVTALVIAGFPIAIVLSWFLEFRHGRAVLHESSPNKAHRRGFSRTYISVIAASPCVRIVVASNFLLSSNPNILPDWDKIYGEGYDCGSIDNRLRLDKCPMIIYEN